MMIIIMMMMMMMMIHTIYSKKELTNTQTNIKVITQSYAHTYTYRHITHVYHIGNTYITLYVFVSPMIQQKLNHFLVTSRRGSH